MNRRDSEWKTIRQGATAIVVACQRAGGLWQLASSPIDIPRTQASATELELRNQESFGFESITVTWGALGALLESFDRPPRWQLERAIDALGRQRSANGAYGTWKGGWHAGRRINESPRHSAMAVLCLLQFSDWLDPRPSYEYCAQTVEWLLETMLPDGGWQYVIDSSDHTAEAVSTAAVIAALCLFEASFQSRATLDTDLSRRLRDAVSRALSLLDTTCSDRLWALKTRETQVGDSAFIVELVCLAESTKCLGVIDPESDKKLSRWVATLMNIALKGSWPSTPGTTLPSLPASIAAASAALRASKFVATDISEFLINVKDFVYGRVTEDGAWKGLGVWDWVQLSRLANAAFTGVPDGKLKELCATVQSLGNASSRARLTRADLRSFPRFSRMPLLFTLTHGRPETVPSGYIAQQYLKLPAVIRLTVESLPGVIVGYALSQLF